MLPMLEDATEDLNGFGYMICNKHRYVISYYTYVYRYGQAFILEVIMGLHSVLRGKFREILNLFFCLPLGHSNVFPIPHLSQRKRYSKVI